ncbi:MAG: hypothetical protein WC050_04475 [Candidatus Paceibacterota bacterium]
MVTFLLTAAAVVLLFMYAYAQKLFGHNETSPKFASGLNQCVSLTADSQIQKSNPNKMLFISCGGFYQ